MTDRIKNIPYKFWSHPFKFIFLPWILVFLVIFYWFFFVPLLLSYYVKSYRPTRSGRNVFLISQLLIFVVILCVLVYIWRKHPGKDKKRPCATGDYCSVTKIDHDLEACSDCVDEAEFAEKRPMLTIDLNKSNAEDVCVRSHPVYEDQRPLSQNLEVALTPRELFFRDLYESVFETDSTITRDFILREREYSSLNLKGAIGRSSSALFPEINSKTSIDSDMNEPSVSDRTDTVGTKLDEKDQVSEFFVANVTPKACVTSEVFLYVCDENEKHKKKSNIVVSI